MANRVSERGQITIDRAIRQHLGIHPGMIAHQRVVGDRLEIVFLPAPHRRSLYGALRREGEAPQVTDADQLEAVVMDAVAAKHAPVATDRD